MRIKLSPSTIEKSLVPQANEDNLFSRVCLSVQDGVPIQGPTPPVEDPNPRTYSNLLNLDLTVQPSMFKLVYYEAWTAMRRAVGIRLKCLLVLELLSIDLIRESSRDHLIGQIRLKCQTSTW